MGRDSALNDSERLTTLFIAHVADIRRFARRRVGADAAEEIVAQTFLAAWRHIERVPDPPLPWLYRTANLEIANLLRSKGRRERFAVAWPDEDLGEPDQVTDLQRTIIDAFQSLDPLDQEVLRLAIWDQVSSAEGAVALGCSVAAYRVRLHRARSRLAKRAGLSSARAPDSKSTSQGCDTDVEVPR